MIRIGIIGTDSTHAVEFTRQLNGGDFDARVVGACAGAATDFPLSVSRREKITDTLTDDLKVPFVDSVEELLAGVDAVMVLSCDGRAHPAEVLPLLGVRKPVFVDKPLAASSTAATGILRAAIKANCPLFSASALRFRPKPPRWTRQTPSHLKVTVPARQEIGHPDLCWYGIHGIEAAYALLGPGCRTVQRLRTAAGDVTVGTWRDGSTLKVHRLADTPVDFPLTVRHGDSQETFCGFSYADLLRAVVAFFQTGIPPVVAEETAEVFAFITAADLSRDSNGADVMLDSLNFSPLR